MPESQFQSLDLKRMQGKFKAFGRGFQFADGVPQEIDLSSLSDFQPYSGGVHRAAGCFVNAKLQGSVGGWPHR
jgi:hypothetical protein